MTPSSSTSRVVGDETCERDRSRKLVAYCRQDTSQCQSLGRKESKNLVLLSYAIAATGVGRSSLVPEYNHVDHEPQGFFRFRFQSHGLSLPLPRSDLRPLSLQHLGAHYQYHLTEEDPDSRPCSMQTSPVVYMPLSLILSYLKHRPNPTVAAIPCLKLAYIRPVGR